MTTIVQMMHKVRKHALFSCAILASLILTISSYRIYIIYSSIFDILCENLPQTLPSRTHTLAIVLVIYLLFHYLIVILYKTKSSFGSWMISWISFSIAFLLSLGVVFIPTGHLLAIFNQKYETRRLLFSLLLETFGVDFSPLHDNGVLNDIIEDLDTFAYYFLLLMFSNWYLQVCARTTYVQSQKKDRGLISIPFAHASPFSEIKINDFAQIYGEGEPNQHFEGI